MFRKRRQTDSAVPESNPEPDRCEWVHNLSLGKPLDCDSQQRNKGLEAA